MATIREATLDDVGVLLEMGQAFHKESPYASVVPYSHVSMRKTFEALLISDETVFLVCEEEGEVFGAVASVITPMMFNTQVRVTSERFWYTKPEYRNNMAGIRLLKELEKKLIEKGADLLTMCCLETPTGFVLNLSLIHI